jgi:BlaI family penicillinase repressor
MPAAPHLTDLQLAVMRALWSRGSATVTELCDDLRPERNLAPTTIATLLMRLEKRRIVRHHTRARQYVYQPVVSEAAVRRSMVGALAERLFDGDVPAFVSHLLTARDLGSDDLARVKELIEAHEAGKESSRDHD